MHSNKYLNRLCWNFLGAGLLSLAAFTQAFADPNWPTKPVTFIVPFPAGGGTDAFARPLSAVLTKNLNKQIIIDNRGGAGGTLGAGIAAKATPDGYTFFVGAAHHAIAPSIYPKLDYDIEKSFLPLALLATPPQVIVVNPQKVQANDLMALKTVMKTKNGYHIQIMEKTLKICFLTLKLKDSYTRS